MRQACVEGKTYRFNGPMAYNMVQSLADFHKDYRCIDETIYDNENYEAACTVSFGQMKQGGKFHTHPGAIDGLTQSGGFIMNANENTKLEQEIFVNHGWKSFQMFEPIRHDRQYKTLARMAPAENKQWEGDIVVWCEDRVVASIKGCCVSRSTMAVETKANHCTVTRSPASGVDVHPQGRYGQERQVEGTDRSHEAVEACSNANSCPKAYNIGTIRPAKRSLTASSTAAEAGTDGNPHCSNASF